MCKLVDLIKSYVRKQKGCFFLNTLYKREITNITVGDKMIFFNKINNSMVVDAFKQLLGGVAVKYFFQISCMLEYSTKTFFTVSRSPQELHVARSSP